MTDITEQDRVCTGCKERKPISAFYVRAKRRLPRSICKTCDNAASLLRDKAARKDPDYRANFIVKDLRKSDKKRGMENDLTVTVVRRLIKNPCQYCDSTTTYMTLDRIDNNVGHLLSNVVPCCIRCNYIKSDMPHEAWVRLVPVIRLAYQDGLFGSWRAIPFARKAS